MAATTQNTTDSNITESPEDNLNSAIRRVICGDDASDPLNALLYDLIEGNTTPALAAAGLLTATRESPDLESRFSHLTAQIISLASQYPLFHPDLVRLIASIMHSAAYFTSETRAAFVKEFATGIGEMTQSNYGLLFEAEQRRRNPRLGKEHVNLNRFIARLLSALGEPREPGEGVTQVQDAMFILSTALEDHASSHKLPNVDVPAAAQYMIHAGEVVFNQCEKGTGRDLASTSPLWATRGKLWTGPPGLTHERWDFWRSRFGEIAWAEDHNISEETRKTAATAVRAMARYPSSLRVWTGPTNKGSNAK